MGSPAVTPYCTERAVFLAPIAYSWVLLRLSYDFFFKKESASAYLLFPSFDLGDSKPQRVWVPRASDLPVVPVQGGPSLPQPDDRHGDPGPRGRQGRLQPF